MKALLLLLPLVAAKNGPVLIPQAGTAGMDSKVFDGMKNAQDMSQRLNSQKRREVVKAQANFRAVGGLLTTLKPVKRQNTRTTTVTEETTIAGSEATGGDVLVTATVTQTVRAQATNAGEGNARGGAEAQGARETVTTTVTAGNAAAEASPNAGVQGSPNGGVESASSPGADVPSSQGSEATSSPNAEATSSAGTEANSSAGSGNSGNNGSPASESSGASQTSEGQVPEGTGGIVLPLSAVVPQDAEEEAGLMGTDIRVGGFVYRGRARAKRRGRLVRKRGLRWLWS